MVKLAKARARLARRQTAHAERTAKMSPERARGLRRPGSMNGRKS